MDTGEITVTDTCARISREDKIHMKQRALHTININKDKKNYQ